MIGPRATLDPAAGIAVASALLPPDPVESPLWTVCVDVGRPRRHGFSLHLVGACGATVGDALVRGAGEAVERHAVDAVGAVGAVGAVLAPTAVDAVGAVLAPTPSPAVGLDGALHPVDWTARWPQEPPGAANSPSVRVASGRISTHQGLSDAGVGAFRSRDLANAQRGVPVFS